MGTQAKSIVFLEDFSVVTLSKSFTNVIKLKEELENFSTSVRPCYFHQLPFIGEIESGNFLLDMLNAIVFVFPRLTSKP